MFRDTYKSVYKDIQPNPELLDKILCADTAKKKIIHRKWVYSLGACAASFILVTCAVLGYLNYEDISHMPAVVDKGDINTVSEPYINEVSPKEDTNIEKTVQNYPVAAPKNSASAQVVSDAADGQKVVESDEVSSDVPKEAAYTEPVTDAQPNKENDTPSPETDVPRAASIVVREMPLTEFNKYIGFNVLEKVTLPADLTYSGEDFVYYDESADMATFCFYGENARFANITFTKGTENEGEIPEEEKSDFSQDNVHYEKANDIYTVSGCAPTFSFEICSNIEESEIKLLADSLVK